MIEPIFTCPVCKGPIAFWAVRSEFTCHHCNMILKSNREEALITSFWIAVSIEILLLILLFFIFDASLNTFIVWGSAGCVIGYFGGWFGVKHFMVFQPMRRTSNTTTQ